MVPLGPRYYDIVSCFMCGEYSPENYFCLDSSNTLTNSYDVVCCPGSGEFETDDKCIESDTNICT